ncbi:MAG: hypothetical protein GX131_13765 [candidate division WS1 bacterium]|nr:hypothetical protein [candidate division WS1 bacterium]
MQDLGKLLAGLAGVIIGLIAGFGALALVMQRTGGALFDRPALGLVVALGLVGGGAALIGYLTLHVIGWVEQRRRRASRRSKQKSGKKK